MLATANKRPGDFSAARQRRLSGALQNLHAVAVSRTMKPSNTSFTNCGRSAPGGSFRLGNEGRGVLLHQAVQRGLLRAVALGVGPGRHRAPSWAAGDGLHARLPRW